MSTIIPIYYENTDGDKVKVFFYIKDGDIRSYTVGNNAVSKKSGLQFYVDENVSLQLRKMNLRMNGLEPILELKDGEELESFKKVDKDEEIRRLKRELEDLKGVSE